MFNIEASSPNIIAGVFGAIGSIFNSYPNYPPPQYVSFFENHFFGNIDHLDDYCFISIELQIRAQIRTRANQRTIKKMNLLKVAKMLAANVSSFFLQN